MFSKVKVCSLFGKNICFPIPNPLTTPSKMICIFYLNHKVGLAKWQVIIVAKHMQNDTIVTGIKITKLFFVRRGVVFVFGMYIQKNNKKDIHTDILQPYTFKFYNLFNENLQTFFSSRIVIRFSFALQFWHIEPIVWYFCFKSGFFRTNFFFLFCFLVVPNSWLLIFKGKTKPPKKAISWKVWVNHWLQPINIFSLNINLVYEKVDFWWILV